MPEQESSCRSVVVGDTDMTDSETEHSSLGEDVMQCWWLCRPEDSKKVFPERWWLCSDKVVPVNCWRG